MTTNKNHRNDHPSEGEDASEHAAPTPEQPDTTSPDTPSASEPEPTDHKPAAAPQPSPADTTPTVVPDSPAELVADPLWAPEDYLGVTGDAAIKLSTSAVAPLLAAARGYRTVEAAGLKDLLAEYQMGVVNSRAGRAFKDAIGLDGALVMPWFSLESVRQAANYHRSAHPVTPQLRPERPPMDDAGRPKKYLFASSASIPLDIHPDTPTDWVGTAPTVLLAEGLLKGDAALTAILRHHGATMEDLAATPGQDHTEAMRRLLAGIPVPDRVLVVSLGGVGNWHNNGDWNTLNLRGRQTWIAVDGDVGENWNVWNQVHQMWELLERKHALPRLVDLAVAVEHPGDDDSDFHGDSSSAQAPTVSKMGMDDYLAQIGPWSSLLPRVVPNLPPCPPKESKVAFKDWRMNDTMCTAEEYVPNPDVSGVNHPRWETRCAISGRIASVEMRREATPTEIRSGHFDDSPEAEATATAECTIEVSFLDETTGARITRTISGPASLLSDPPAEWHRRGATLPTEIHKHRDWPPPLQWRGAMKGHHPEKQTDRFAWAQMGWVPVPGGNPVYVVGDQVIGTVGFTDTATPGITEHALSGASRFGVDLPADIEQARTDLRELVDVYYSGGAWADQRLGALVVAAGIRPAVPIRPHTSIFFEGKKASGKTWSASAIMAFWQSGAGGWGDKLPGGATDTMASTELAVSRANIWVIDDLAPTGDQRQAQAELARLGDLIRSVHNGSGKRRADQNMGLRATHDPRALLIITAENEHNVASVRDRIVFAPVKGLGTDEAVAAVERMRNVTGVPGRVSGAVVRDLARLTSTHGWSQYCGMLSRMYDRDSKTAADVTGDGDKAIRHGKLAADLTLGIRVLTDYAEEIGCKDLYPFFGQMARDVFSLVADHYVSQKATTPGRSALAAVRAILASGQAHIVSLTAPAAPPATGEEASSVNNLLGWTATPDGGSRPGGSSIGWIAYPKGEGVVFLNAIPAFNEARRHHPDLIPFGSTYQAAWKSAWEEGLCSQRWARKMNNGGRRRITVRATGGRAEGESKTWSVEGVPIPLKLIVDAAAAAEPDDENDPEEV